MQTLLPKLEHYWKNGCRKLLSSNGPSSRDYTFFRKEDDEAAVRKSDMMANRGARIVKNTVRGKVLDHHSRSERDVIDYTIEADHFVIHKNKSYIETSLQIRKAVFEDGLLIDEYAVNPVFDETSGGILTSHITDSRHTEDELWRSPVYNRLEAVKYAERWWNDYNPSYRRFEDNCTNFVSQCLRAGGAPKWGQPKRSTGWWYGHSSWSFSWSVAHSFRWYLSGSDKGLRAAEVSSPELLMKGDVICYDFTGDGRWQHTTIVTGKDADQMPLVNAQTANSRMRYWSYEDSTAWTPEIKYKFFRIHDNLSL